MGHVPADWEGAGQLSPLGDMEADKADATSERGQDVDVSSPVGSYGGGGSEGDSNLRHPLPKH